MNILSMTTAIQSNKRTESVSSVHVSRIEPRIVSPYQTSNYFVFMPICDSRLCDALLPFPSNAY